MPITIPYESVVRETRYETDADGNLHITIPPQNFGFLGMKPVYSAPALGFPPLFVLAAFGLYHFPILPAAALSIAMAVMLLLFGWLDTYRYRFTTQIDTTSSTLTIRRQRGASVSYRHFSRDRLQAIGVVCESDDVLSWILRVHGPYEWETALSGVSHSDLDEIANRLRVFLQLPEKPPSL